MHVFGQQEYPEKTHKVNMKAPHISVLLWGITATLYRPVLQTVKRKTEPWYELMLWKGLFNPNSDVKNFPNITQISYIFLNLTKEAFATKVTENLWKPNIANEQTKSNTEQSAKIMAKIYSYDAVNKGLQKRTKNAF